MLSQPKWQPGGNLKEHLEEENEPLLDQISGDIVIIKYN